MSTPNLASLSIKERAIHQVLSHIRIGSLEVTFPHGQIFHYGDRQHRLTADLQLVDPKALLRIIRGGTLGFAEAYMDQLIRSRDLSNLLTLLASNLAAMRGEIDNNWMLRAATRFVHLLRPNSRRGARRNIQAHYDLGNAFYEKWLDPSMTYSSALFDGPEQSLEAGQKNKYRSIAHIGDIAADHSVLEIGCGWGGFSEYASHHIGCDITGITISDEQFEYATNRLRHSPSGNHANIRFQDYRDVPETYDRIVSIEMFEAVGQKYWPVYFSKIYNALKPGGKAALQIITIRDQDFDRYSQGADFIQRYIFPGGMLPSMQKLREQFHSANLKEYASLNFGADYARTLRAWHAQFLQAWPRIKNLGFDERFKNMWCYYLAYCEAGFKTGSIDVVQIGLERPH